MPYDTNETAKLLRRVAAAKMLPGGELTGDLGKQLELADQEITELRRKAWERDQLMPKAAIEPNLAPPPVRPTTGLQPPNPGDPINPFMHGDRVEAPPPVPFNETPQGLEAAAAAQAEEAKKPRRRRKHVAPK